MKPPSPTKILKYFNGRQIENTVDGVTDAMEETLEHLGYEYHPEQLRVWVTFQMNRKFNHKNSYGNRARQISARVISRDLNTYFKHWYEKHLEILYSGG